MNFKVGDRVRVRADLLYAPCMSRFRGKEYIIRSACEDDNTYEFCGNIYTWSGEMLEPAWPGWTLIVRPDKADPDKTIAILKVDGKETRHESVKRYYKDEYNSGAAIRGVVTKLLLENYVPESEKADEPVIGPPATVEPPKPEPVMIGGRELKVGSKFILKPYNAIYASQWDIPVTAIDRILED